MHKDSPGYLLLEGGSNLEGVMDCFHFFGRVVFFFFFRKSLFSF